MSKSIFSIALIVSIVALGCAPRVRINKNPTNDDTGIRYYRPKPYLLVSPANETTKSGDNVVTRPSDQFVSLELKYLPDFGEEYSINVTPGLGSANVSVGLEDGWNLTTLNQTLDTQFDENISAVASLVGAVAPKGLVGTSGEGQKPHADDKITVAARNVPIGFYEAVIGIDHRCGKKQLYGWRYVGFAPYNACPLYANGADCVRCEDGSLAGALYGLSFVKGVMVFRSLHDMQGITLDEATKTDEPAPDVSKPLNEDQIGQIQASVLVAFNGIGMPSGVFPTITVDPASTTADISAVIDFPTGTVIDTTNFESVAKQAIKTIFDKAKLSVVVTVGGVIPSETDLDLSTLLPTPVPEIPLPAIGN